MQVITAITAMQTVARRIKTKGGCIGLVPTMGCLHDGHLSLIREARRRMGPQGRVVLSLYVNPTQFGPREDWANYPRDLARDRHLCRAAGVDILFVPTDAQMYPGRAAGRFSTCVVEEKLSQGMEGTSRPAHFRGVTTVVAKLFHLVLPDVAVFGAKDFQQAAVVQRMVRDLNFPVRIVVAPTRRERDGLALSSRNQSLTPEERNQAVILWQAIQKARSIVRAANTAVSAHRLKQELTRLIATQPAARVDYVAFCDPKTLEPVDQVRRGAQLALAVYVGRTRLIDNAKL